MVVEARLKENRWLQGRSRGVLYSFFSAVFNDEVKMENVEEFIKEENINHLKGIFSLLPPEKGEPLRECLETMAADWQKRCKEYGLEEESLELRREFAYLFLTPKGVYPFESVYRGQKNLLMDKPWEEVRAFYRRLGLEKEKKQLHPEDHAAVELGLMAVLAFLSGGELPGPEEEEMAEEEGYLALQAQQDFLQEHLLAWLPQLCADIVGKTRHPFYRAAASLTALFLEADRQMLQNLTSSN